LPSLGTPAQIYTAIIAIVKDAQNIEIGSLLRSQRGNQSLTIFVSAHDDRAAIETAFFCLFTQHRAQRKSFGNECNNSDTKECGKPYSQLSIVQSCDVRQAYRRYEDYAPAEQQSRDTQKAGLKVLYLIDIESLQDRHRGGGYT
jgi:hypothetical protein